MALFFILWCKCQRNSSYGQKLMAAWLHTRVLVPLLNILWGWIDSERSLLSHSLWNYHAKTNFVHLSYGCTQHMAEKLNINHRASCCWIWFMHFLNVLVAVYFYNPLLFLLSNPAFSFFSFCVGMFSSHAGKWQMYSYPNWIQWSYQRHFPY